MKVVGMDRVADYIAERDDAADFHFNDTHDPSIPYYGHKAGENMPNTRLRREGYGTKEEFLAALFTDDAQKPVAGNNALILLEQRLEPCYATVGMPVQGFTTANETDPQGIVVDEPKFVITRTPPLAGIVTYVGRAELPVAHLINDEPTVTNIPLLSLSRQAGGTEVQISTGAPQLVFGDEVILSAIHNQTNVLLVTSSY